MTKDKQLEKKELIEFIFLGTNLHYEEAEQIGQWLYNAGYRKQEWISVDERLPKQLETVLVCCEGIVSIDFIYSRGRWYEYYVHGMVTHWMPLPEAPKMKGGE